MKASDSLVLARGEVKKAIAALSGLEKLLEDALVDIEKADKAIKAERKSLFKRKTKA